MTKLHLVINTPEPGGWNGRLDVGEALEAAHWTTDPTSGALRHPSGAVWVVVNDADDSGLDLPNGTVIEFPGSTPTVVIVAACLAAAATPAVSR
ncbi:hypothetical protein ACFWN1_05705 [Streptomyces sp. NPDC058459]|uniref:hypothetical protein n=1 Tax=Streptomyces sp. NPDC058459 TaxID=3346508 RepID=UPI003659C87C